MFANLSNGWKTVLQVFFVLGVLGAAIAILAYMGGFKTNTTSHRLKFTVNASGGFALITLDAGNTSISTPKQVTVPWSQTVDVQSGTEVYFTASNPTATGELTCAITLDRVAWKKETTSAPKNGVACAGIVP